MSIAIERLVHTYPAGVTAVNDVSLNIEQGERVAIVGQNGAGKTTLVRHLNGIYTATSGSVSVDEWDPAEKTVAQLAHKVGYVFQNPDDQLFARSVFADVEFGPRNLGFDQARRRTLVEWALEATRLTDLTDAHPYHLSPAQRKRVALASVLAMDTPIVVLDEPTTGQDFTGVGDVVGVIDELSAQRKTVISITHDMDFCAENFPRVIAMAQARVVADKAPAAVFSDRDTTTQAAIEPPQLMRLTEALKWPTPPARVNEFVDRFAQGLETDTSHRSERKQP